MLKMKYKKGQGIFLPVFSLLFIILIAFAIYLLLRDVEEESELITKSVGEQALVISEFNLESEKILFNFKNFARYSFDKALIKFANSGGLWDCSGVISGNCLIKEETLLDNFSKFFEEEFEFFVEKVGFDDSFDFEYEINESLEIKIDSSKSFEFNGSDVWISFEPDFSVEFNYTFSEFLEMDEKLKSAFSCLNGKDLNGCLDEGFKNLKREKNVVYFEYGPLDYESIKKGEIFIKAGVDLKNSYGKTMPLK